MNHTQDKAVVRLTGRARVVLVMTFSFRHTCAAGAGVPIPEGKVIRTWARLEQAARVS